MAGSAGRHRFWGIRLVVVGSALIAACSSAGTDAIVPPPPPEPDGSVPDTSAGTTGNDQGADLADLEATWATVWEAVGASSAERPAAIDDVRELLGPAALAVVEDGFDGEGSYSVTNHAVLSSSGSDTATISDCLFVVPATLTGFAYWFEGTASLNGDGGWVINALEPRSRTGCLPADLADEILVDYGEFWDARAEYWNPADPDHPDVTGTMTGSELERFRGLLAQHQQDGWHAVNTIAATHPEVIRILGPGQVVVLDCQLAAQDRGLFDAEGNRQSGLSQPEAGQRDSFEVTLRLEEGQWKASKIQVEEAAECDFAPTPQGLPVV